MCEFHSFVGCVPRCLLVFLSLSLFTTVVNAGQDEKTESEKRSTSNDIGRDEFKRAKERLTERKREGARNETLRVCVRQRHL